MDQCWRKHWCGGEIYSAQVTRRNRGGVAAGLAILLALVAGLVGMYWQATRARAERDRARTEAATAQRVTDFLVDLFTVADPSESKGQTVTAEQLLERGTKKVERQLRDEPVVRARLLDTLGRVHQALGLSSRAKPLLEEGLDRTPLARVARARSVP